jgi:hypothetical protein
MRILLNYSSQVKIVFLLGLSWNSHTTIFSFKYCAPVEQPTDYALQDVIMSISEDYAVFVLILRTHMRIMFIIK